MRKNCLREFLLLENFNGECIKKHNDVINIFIAIWGEDRGWLPFSLGFRFPSLWSSVLPLETIPLKASITDWREGVLRLSLGENSVVVMVCIVRWRHVFNYGAFCTRYLLP